MQPWPDSLTQALLDESAEDLYEHAPCGYGSLLPDGTIGKINATFLDWTGFTRPDIVGEKRLIDLLTVGSRIYYETHFQPLLRMQGQVREIAFDLICRDGRRMPVLVNATERRYDDVGVIVRITIFDATQRRHYERELLAARKIAEEAAAARSELIASLSHDVRTPLGAIATAAALLEQTSPTPQQARYIRVLQSSTSHALTLLNSMLDYSRLESGRARLREQLFDLHDVAGHIVATARAADGEKAVDVSAEISPAVPAQLIGDAAKLGQVLANLLMNAVKFTELGFITLKIDATSVDPDAVTLAVVVSDSGIGIPPESVPHIFDEFTQANDDIASTYGGTGLGLAICRRILALYGSTLHVSSTVGQGSVFSFEVRLRRPTA